MIVGNIEVYYVNKAIDIFVKNKNNYILKETINNFNCSLIVLN
jgi:hypothetical protein